MRLGIDTFSIRSQGWDAFQILDYAAGLGLQNVHFSERAHLGGLETEHLANIRRRAEELDLSLEIGMRSFNRLAQSFDASLGSGEQQLLTMIEAAVTVGSPIVRCFVGFAGDRAIDGGAESLIAESVRTLRAVVPRAETADVTIAVENHGGVDLLAPELRELIEAVASPSVRVCLDTGNPMYAAEDALYAVEVLAPLAATTHIRDTRVWLIEDGALAQWVPMGQGNLDLGKVLTILRREAPGTPLDLEEISGGQPHPIHLFDSAGDFWRLYPSMRASSLARFIATARRGTAAPFAALPRDAAPEELAWQQRDHFEQSLRHVRDVLSNLPEE